MLDSQTIVAKNLAISNQIILGAILERVKKLLPLRPHGLNPCPPLSERRDHDCLSVRRGGGSCDQDKDGIRQQRQTAAECQWSIAIQAKWTIKTNNEQRSQG